MVFAILGGSTESTCEKNPPKLGFFPQKSTPRKKINMEHTHGGLVQIIFLSKWVICRFQPLIFQGVTNWYPKKIAICLFSSRRDPHLFQPAHHAAGYRIQPLGKLKGIRVLFQVTSKVQGSKFKPFLAVAEKTLRSSLVLYRGSMFKERISREYLAHGWWWKMTNL